MTELEKLKSEIQRLKVENENWKKIHWKVTKMTEFSNLLKVCRKTFGLTQYAIAKTLGIAKAEYAMYENAMRLPKKEKYDEFDRHYKFEQFEGVREAIIDKVSDYLDSASMYELFQLERKLELLRLKKWNIFL